MAKSAAPTWADDLVLYFRELGNRAHYSELYKHIQANPKRKLVREWQAVVRRTIEEHSSDTTIWSRRRLPDLFRSVNGLGAGVWELRDAAYVPVFSLAVGEEVRRTDLHREFGGSGQGGISPSTRSSNVFLFSDPTTGLQHGYVDGWKSDGCFHYTGMGQRGDQEMTSGNASILTHKKRSRPLRLFDGSRGTVTYMGQFEVDADEPFYFTDAPETGDGPTRTVIMFRLRPVGDVARSMIVEEAPPYSLIVTEVPIEAQLTERMFINPRAQVTEAERKESSLVQLFKNYAERNSLTPIRNKIVPAGEAKPLFTDIYVKELDLLIEAKGSCERGAIRMAIGQIADYRRYLPRVRCAILLPSKPKRDLLDFAGVEMIGVIWPVRNGFESTLDILP